MALLKRPAPANLTCSVTYRDAALYEEAVALLEQVHGPRDTESDPYDFSAISDHYDTEMGGAVMKRIVSFERLLPREHLAEVKRRVTELEQRFAVEGHRRVNLDPGLLTMENFVLATAKNHSHRIYLGDGVFAEVTLLFTRHATIQGLPWTYRDYLRDPAAAFLLSLRDRYKKKLAETGAAA
ncbi:MAG TPA: DUF4416 family protein [bacterium]|nr:DUF4416 family protein [bacterium]